MRPMSTTVHHGTCDEFTYWADSASYWFRATLRDLQSLSVYHPSLLCNVMSHHFARLQLRRIIAEEVSP